MSAAETVLIIISALFSAAVIIGIVLTFVVPFFKEKRGAVQFAVLFALVCAAVTGSVAAAVHYGLNAGQVWSSALLAASAALAVIAILTVAGVLSLGRRTKMSLLTGTVIAIVFLLQVAVNVAYPNEFDDPEKRLSGGALFVRVIADTFQYFSLDAGYTDIIRVGAERLPVGGVYVFYVLACAMTVIAPIVGGFAIFGVLGHFFPKVSLWRSIQPTKYVFSELNEYSIETAESIASIKTRLRTNKAYRTECITRYGSEWCNEVMHSVIVFTDVYSDRKTEVGAELLQRAYKINAICLKDDILERKIYWIAGYLYRAITHTPKKVVYFLMDKSDFYVEQGDENNLRTAVSLFSAEKCSMMWAKTHWWQTGMKTLNVEVVVFSRNENAYSVINDARTKWIKKYTESNPRLSSDELIGTVKFKTINEYQNLVYGLINGDKENAFPLYKGLEQPQSSGQYNTEKLSVLIVGGGRIAKTFIKTAYYCGQMLNGDKPTRLKITVMSLDAGNTQESLKFEMPAVFADNLCNYDNNPESYCEFDFIKASYGTVEFENKFKNVAGGSNCSTDVDYVLVALGADNLNMQAAAYIKRELGRMCDPDKKVIPINYVIENNDLCAALGLSTKSDGNAQSQKKEPCVLNPFGALAERFSFENITMPEFEKRAMDADKKYSVKKGKASFDYTAYKRDSSIATVIHDSYKSVCLTGDKATFEKLGQWLEHRRWNAYMRSIGYRNYTAQEFARLLEIKVAPVTCFNEVQIKNEALKLHACITECATAAQYNITDTNAIKGFLDAHPDFHDKFIKLMEKVKNGEADGITDDTPIEVLSGMLMSEYKEKFDCLDALSAISSGYKDGGAAREFNPQNYKDFDLEGVMRLPEYAKFKNEIAPAKDGQTE